MPTMPAASPSSPSTKFTALIVTTTTSTVSATSSRRRQHGHAEERQREQLDALVGHQPGGEQLAGQLGHGVQAAQVVDHAEGADERGTEQHGLRLPGGEDLGQERQVPGQQHRRGEAQEHPDAAEPRHRLGVHVAVAHRASAPTLKANQRTSGVAT